MNKSRLLITFVLCCLFALNVQAEEVYTETEETSDYRIEDLRAYLVGDHEYDQELDYNGDGKIDLSDLIETKDLSIAFADEEEEKNQVGFGEITGRADAEVGKTTTTTAKAKRATSHATTAGSGSGTTAKKSTTVKNTTAKNTTTKKATTAKNTTTKTTTTTAAVTYQIQVNVTNGTVAESLKRISKGAKGTFVVTPNTGYAVDKITCQNGTGATYNASSNTATIGYVKKDDVCTVTMKKATVSVRVTATNGTVGTSTVKGEYGTTGSTTVKPSTYYTFESVSCDNGINATWSNNTLSIPLNTSGTCKVTFIQETYHITIQMDQFIGEFDATYSTHYKVFDLSSTEKYTKITCNGASASLSTSQSGNTYYYKVSMIVKNDVSCVMS